MNRLIIRQGYSHLVSLVNDTHLSSQVFKQTWLGTEGFIWRNIYKDFEYNLFLDLEG